MKYLLILFTFLLFLTTHAQKSVCFTIDDVPSPSTELNFVIDSLGFPATIFISEHKLFINDSLSQKQLRKLETLLENKLTTAGNHTFGHSSYSKIGFQPFSESVIKGEKYSRELLPENKTLKHFRFPFNDLGIDSLQQDSISQFLAINGYQISPFTVESSDYIFSYIYSYYKEKGNTVEAEKTGLTYVEYTLSQFEYFDSLTVQQYGKHIPQIYLCHDNQLNCDYLGLLIEKLQAENYSIITYEDALNDEVYSNENYYQRKYGVSWIYRWMDSHNERIKLMKKEPLFPQNIDEDYERIKQIKELEKE